MSEIQSRKSDGETGQEEATQEGRAKRDEGSDREKEVTKVVTERAGSYMYFCSRISNRGILAVEALKAGWQRPL